MPLHFGSLSRRQFITRTLAGGVAVFTARAGWAAEGGEERWVLMSDTHIDADPATVNKDVNMAEHLRSAVAEITTLAPTNVLVNGDLSYNHAVPGDYDQFRELLQPLTSAGFTLHCTMGNHDGREVFWEHLKDQAAQPPLLAGRHLSIIETPLANWFLLDSLIQTLTTPGELGDEQRTWLGEALDARASKPALLLVHHDVLPRPDKKPSGLKDVEALLAIAQPRKQVKAILCGHTHVWRHAESEGLHLVNLPAVAYPFSPQELTGWVDCRLQANGMKLTPQGFDKANPKHQVPLELKWRV